MHLRKRCLMFLACTKELQLDKNSSRVLIKRSHDKDLRHSGIGHSNRHVQMGREAPRMVTKTRLGIRGDNRGEQNALLVADIS